tara:strand:- start:135 stop:281 length:147 start_codon:yes stop_codon:yes gene_type:complete
MIDRMPIPSIALTTDSSFITAWSNDIGFESVFSRQILCSIVEFSVLKK